MRILKITSVILGLGLLLQSCGNEGSEQALTLIQEANAQEDKNSFQIEKVNQIFFSVPSPMEMATMLKGSGSKYNHELLNDITNRDKYTSSFSKAVNLGVYGADLSYASVFNRNQESILYMSSAKQLADELGVSAAFDANVMNRIEENVDNRDSLLSIISETYYILDSYLKENNRSAVSAQVISGGWIEGLYIAACVYENDEAKSPELVTRIVDQKYALEDLISLIDSYNTTGTLDEIEKDLKTLKTAFDKSKVIESDATADTSEKVVLGTKQKLTMEQEDMVALVSTLKEIRNKYVNV